MWLVHRKLVFCLRSQVRGSVRKRNNNFQCLLFLHSCHCQKTVLKEKKFYSFLPRNSADNVFCVSKRLIYTIDARKSQAFLIPFLSQTHPTKLSWGAAEEQARIGGTTLASTNCFPSIVGRGAGRSLVSPRNSFICCLIMVGREEVQPTASCTIQMMISTTTFTGLTLLLHNRGGTLQLKPCT